jgi:peptidoglycan/LPS O-acetylase OafA/YrhL
MDDRNIRDGRIASLDGLRAVAISLVLLAHLLGTRNFPVPLGVGGFIDIGDIGVRVFFVISGFLITHILLEELERRGHIDLARFYFRRTLRIFPAYYVYIVTLAVLAARGAITLMPFDVVHAVTYTTNYDPTRSWNVGHTWSLSVEEQFYLLWPAVLVVMGRRRALAAAGMLIAVAPMIRLLVWWLAPDSGVGHRFETVADAIVVGCLLAGLRGRLHGWPLYRRLLASRAFVLVPCFVVAAAALHDRPRINFAVAFTVMNVGVALCVDWCVSHRAGRVGRLLNARPMVLAGVGSYSIYIWQQIFLNRASAAAANAFPLNIALVAVAAVASYWLIERPSLTLRASLDRRLFRRGIQQRAADVAARQGARVST